MLAHPAHALAHHPCACGVGGLEAVHGDAQDVVGVISQDAEADLLQALTMVGVGALDVDRVGIDHVGRHQALANLDLERLHQPLAHAVGDRLFEREVDDQREHPCSVLQNS